MPSDDPRSRQSYQKGVERRAAIIEVAVDMVLESGGSNISMRELARRCGLSQSGLLHHFADSTAVLTAVIEEKEALLAGRAAELRGHPADQMIAVEAYDDGHRGVAALFTMLAAEGIFPAHPAHDYFVRRYERVMVETEQMICDLQRAGGMRHDIEPVDAAALMVMMLDGARLVRQYLPGVDSASAIRTLWRLLAAAPADHHP